MALGGKLICIGWIGYQTTPKPAQPYQRDPTVYAVHLVNKWTKTFFPDDVLNPFPDLTKDHYRQQEVQHMLFLNGVCRQMYQETAELPYRLNRWAFDSQQIMYNFLFHKCRVLRASQRNAIQVIVARSEMVPLNVVNFLTGLERVYIAKSESPFFEQGWYKVVEGDEQRELVSEAPGIVIKVTRPRF